MPNYPLSEFVNIVPSCSESTTLAIALEICSQVLPSKAVVLNELQTPLGIISSGRIVSHLLCVASSHQRSAILDQPLVTALMEPITTLSASLSVEKLSKLMRDAAQSNRELNWVLVDSQNKYLGIIDYNRLGQYLTSTWRQKKRGTEPLSVVNEIQPLPEKTLAKYLKTQPINKPKENSNQSVSSPSLTQLLEKLPWPLMVETSSGEVVAQNPAWEKHLERLKDSELVQQVETMLIATATKSPWDAQNPLTPTKPHGLENLHIEPLAKSSRCYLDNQPGSCTCVVEVEDGQERVWRFAKIPLEITGANLENLHGNMAVTNSTAKSDLWLILVTDVTEQQRLCKELAAKNADLIRLNRLKDEFLACISHELKTPLTAVLGLSRLLVNQQLGKLNSRQARYAGLIHQSGRHLMSIVNDILDLTRMETGQMELSLSKINIRDLCDRAIESAKAHHAQNNKIPNDSLSIDEQYKFSFYIEPDLSEMVADDLRLRQMLGHLLSNAFKFTQTGGEIELSINTWKGWVAFTVRDTGIGIPEHQQHLIFQKFQQLENPLTRQFEGTGLGLVLTRALARLHGGDVSFLSREGEGSQFTLLLPPSPPQKRNGSETEFPSSNKSAPVIVPSTPVSTATNSNNLVLVVETVTEYIENITVQLRTLGYQVVIARSGCEAIEKARRLQPHAIFINPLLPLLSGWDVLTLLKSDSVTRHICVIITATTAEKEQALAHRADGFLPLPVENQVLAPLLNNLSTTKPTKQRKQDKHTSNISKTPLRILRLADPASQDLGDRTLLEQHRVIEVDDLEQAEILKRVWHFDVVLLDVEMPKARLYLQNLPHYRDLMSIPLVTRSVEATQLALKIPQLSVFPCLLSSNSQDNQHQQINSLLSVLQIAAGRYTPPSILVADLAMLPDLPAIKKALSSNHKGISTRTQTQTATQIQPLSLSRGSQWFQALVQYLQTAGLKAEISRTWAEMLQQLRHKSVDLLLICWGESQNEHQMQSALNKLHSTGLSLPPILILDERLNSTLDIESINSAQILPRSISMEELLNQINQALN